MDATNRLADEKSPYLLQHAHNPVDWHPWGEEAFARARREDRPIFLSIGYSTCHWCHVMAHESFENPRTAAVMNELFVNVKLDREERPDVDRVYMTFVQATTGSGGWPMSVWLQPDLKPIVGGTYFPPDDRYGRRGFVSVCRAVADAWRDDREKVLAQGERIVEALRSHAEVAAPAVTTAANEKPIADTMREALRPFVSTFDPEWGGFGDAPKFPRPVTLALLARIHARLEKSHPAESAQARDMMLATLDHMAAGGMHDQLGGGFHRYSVDRFWHVPHFEKMLYDQAQLVVAYLEAFQITGNPAYAATARDVLVYVSRDLRSPEGAFYCAEDADSLLAAGRPEHAEGAFYVWAKDEIDKELPPDEAAVFCARYGVEAKGNTPDGSDPQGEFTGKNVLFVQGHGIAAETDGTLEAAKRRLFEVRARRPRPHLDDKIVTAWNGLIISAFARAYQILSRPDDLETATRAATFIHDDLYDAAAGTLRRSYRAGPGTVGGFADDYAFLIQGLLDLYEADFDFRWLEWAQRLQAKQDELFGDPTGGYFSSAGGDPSVLLRLKEDHDGAEPAASSVAALNLARLAALTGNDAYLDQAKATTESFGAAQSPMRTAQAMPLMLVALDFLAQPPAQVVLVGAASDVGTRALLRTVRERFSPHLVVLLSDPADAAGRRRLVAQHPYLENATMQGGKPTAYLCENGACQLPTTDPVALTRQLAGH